MFLIRVWYGNDVSLLSFVVFGRICFVHVPKDERSKLDVQSKRCIFIQYGHDEFAYKCYKGMIGYMYICSTVYQMTCCFIYLAIKLGLRNL